MGRRSVAVLCCVPLLLAGCGESPPARPGAESTTSRSPTPAPTPAASTSQTQPPATTTPPATWLVTFTQLRTAEPGNIAAEVTSQAQGDRFLNGMGLDDQVRAAVQRARQPGTRLFAFTFSGCQFTGASLVIQGSRVYAIPTGGGNVQCFVAEYFLAVYAIPVDQVPANAKIG
jgi:hypothetical protein